ncbi:MAG: hypothetical protein A2219_01220 [Elusimicrobia bacterium RIFOXYA2_FULL_50_26]|nr:MAG: hypothetical protein A2219_01220 [Elusimicrobia bacterium RIFOXYA2_FULL_50_26]OGS22325.1 MAG: hypothetical protein A2314_08695 [Elusimicrobia bacterium RIFOXYB2_FULL_50_12]
MIYLTMGLMLVFALLAIFLKDILLSVLSLAAVSTLLSIAFFQFGAPVAGALELSVGAGLITVLVVLTISFIQQKKEIPHKRTITWALFSFIAAAAAAGMFMVFTPKAVVNVLTESPWREVGEIFWKVRSFDILPQALVILSAAFGVLALLRADNGRE